MVSADLEIWNPEDAMAHSDGYLMKWTDTRKKSARLVMGMAAVFLLFFLMLPAVACAEEAGFIAKIEGKVDIYRSGASQAVPAMLNDTVSIGDVIRTKSGGKVEIHFIDNTVLRLASGSRLKIDKYVFNPDKTRQSAAVTLFRGKLRAIVTKASSVVPVSSATSTFNINTPTAVAGVLGTDLFVYHENGVTGVLFKDGHGTVFNANNPAGAVSVSAGQVTFVTGGDAPPLEPRPATDLELNQHVKATTASEGVTTGDTSGDMASVPIEIFMPEPAAGDSVVSSTDATFVVPPVNLIAADISPVVTILNPPATFTNISTLGLTVVSTKPVTITYVLNGIGIVTDAGLTVDTLNVAGLAEGPQSLTITVTDAAGNSSVPLIISWTTDYTAPVINFTATPPSLTNLNAASFGLSSSETVSYTYDLDGVNVGTSEPSGVPEGANTFTVTATDPAGNSSAPISYSWMTDYGPPVAYFVTTPTAVNASTTANFSFSSDDPAASLSYSLDGGVTWTSSTGAEIFNDPANFGEGLQTLSIMAVDAAGNVSTTSYTWFYGKRQYDMTGAAVDETGAAVLSATATGNLNLISTGTQGGWLLGLTGTYIGTPSTSVVAGGTATDSQAVLDGYWLDKIDLSAGTSNFTYLSKTVYGAGTGTVIGGYDGLAGLNATDTGLGTYTETPLDFSGDVWGGLLWYDPSIPSLRYANAFYGDTTPNVNGIIGLVGNLWTNGSAQAYLRGTYNTYSGAEPYLIYGSGWYMNYDPTMTGYSTSLGGAFNGYNVGVWNNGVTKSNAVAIYIDPNGNAGYMQGGLDGAYYSGLGMWEMSGPLSTTFVETTSILPADLAASLTTGHYGSWGASMVGSFAGYGPTNWPDGLISAAYVEGSLKGLSGHNWGVWNGGMGGSYDTYYTSSSFTADVGATNFSYNGYSGYMLGSMTSADWGAAGNTFTGSLSTQFMTPTLFGYMTTDGLYGTFDPQTGEWQSSMVGTWSATPLAHVSDIYANAYYIGDPYAYGYSYSVYDGSINGYLGGTQSLWASASTPVTFMGGYDPVSPASHIWGTEFSSYNYIDYTDTTYDNGAYYGYLTGTEASGAMETLLYAMYVDDSNNVGYLKGGLSGSYHSSVGIFEQTGNIDKVEMASATGITVADFYNSIYFSYGGEGQLSGPSLSGYDNGLYTMTLVDPLTAVAQDWGLYYHEFTGQSVNPAANWTAKAGGNDGIGVVNPYVSNNGTAYYADGGYYSYTYYSNNNYGSQNYFRPSIGAGTNTVYYSDGSTWISNYAWGDPYGYGYSYWYYTGTVAGAPWDTATSLSTLATPLDSANVTSSDAPYTYVGGNDDWAYWLMDVTGSSWANGKLTASATGKFLSHYAIGTLTGDLTGVYDPASGVWSANGVGIYESTPLAFGGDISGNYYAFDNTDYYCYYCLYSTDWMNGYFGATQSPFVTPDTPVDLYLMGNNYRGSAPGTWWGSIEGGNYVDTASHWYGWTAGVSRPDDTMVGMLETLYIDASGNAGILSGDFIGVTYPDLSIFYGQGTLTARQLSSGYDPALYWNYVNTGSPDGYIDGQFAGNTGYVNSAGYTLQSIKAYLSETATYWFANPNTGLDETWGIYKLELGGEYDNPDGATTFSMFTGGNGWKAGGEYWLADISGNWNPDQTVDGLVNGMYMTPFVLGQINGKMYGSYDTVNPGTWEGVAMGDFTETPLAWSGVIDYDYNDNGLYNGCEGLCGIGDTYGGLAGGTQSPWSGTTSLTLMGPYSAWDIAPYLWNAPIYSYDQTNFTYATYDGGAFWGVTGGVWQNGAIDAAVYALYIDPNGNAGILKGSMTGAYYSALNNMFRAYGQWTPTILTTGLDPAQLGSLTYSPDLTWWTYGASGAGDFTAGGSISEWQTEGRSYSIPGENWGVSQSLTLGGYSDTSSDTWSFSSNYIDSTKVIGTQTAGTQWSNGVLKGQTYGFGADIAAAAPKTWISVGETFGTFDATALTWQAAQTSAFIETSRYLAMMQTVEGQAALTQLNIPFAEVGNANLSGSVAMGDGTVNVNMNNVTFLAYSSGAAPKIWATGDVNGAYTCTTCGAANVLLTGNGINTDFNITTFDTVTNMNWMATVTGGGTYSGTGSLDGSAVQMTGAAAGTIDTATTSFTGTAAGTAQ